MELYVIKSAEDAAHDVAKWIKSCDEWDKHGTKSVRHSNQIEIAVVVLLNLHNVREAFKLAQ